MTQDKYVSSSHHIYTSISMQEKTHQKARYLLLRTFSRNYASINHLATFNYKK